jgi:hypothetical protein
VSRRAQKFTCQFVNKYFARKYPFLYIHPSLHSFFRCFLLNWTLYLYVVLSSSTVTFVRNRYIFLKCLHQHHLFHIILFLWPHRDMHMGPILSWFFPEMRSNFKLLLLEVLKHLNIKFRGGGGMLSKFHV